jgi:hypothetical protein
MAGYMYRLCSFICIASAASSVNQVDYHAKFDTFIQKYDRDYSGAEKELRFSIFVKNVKQLAIFDGPDGMFGVNAFTDVDWETELLQPRHNTTAEKEEHTDVGVGSGCQAYTDCKTCVSKKLGRIGACAWCATDNQCHTAGSTASPCTSSN